jgi:hypothetical protein
VLEADLLLDHLECEALVLDALGDAFHEVAALVVAGFDVPDARTRARNAERHRKTQTQQKGR